MQEKIAFINAISELIANVLLLVTAISSFVLVLVDKNKK